MQRNHTELAYGEASSDDKAQRLSQSAKEQCSKLLKFAARDHLSKGRGLRGHPGNH